MISTLHSLLRSALLGLLARPGFSALVVLTLALGIGANVAIYSLFQQVLLAPLPVHQPQGLVNLSAPGPKPGSTSCNASGDCEAVFSYPMYLDLAREQQVFEGIAAHRIVDVNLAMDGNTRSAQGVLVSGSYFPLLGLQAALGRLLTTDDQRVEGEAEAVVLGYSYWQNTLGADPQVLGRTLIVNGKPLTIVGVAPRGFNSTTLGTSASVFLPISFRWLSEENALPNHVDRRSYWAYLFARLKPGVSIDEASLALQPLYRRLLEEIERPLQSGMSEQGLQRFVERPLRLEPGQRGQSATPAQARAPMSILLALASLVLLIACVNIANLMLVRGAERSGELAVRASLGATRGRVVAQLLSECGLLALCAAILSLPVAVATQRTVVSLLPGGDTQILNTSLDLTSIVAALLIASICTLLFALFPVLQSLRIQPAEAMKAQNSRGTGNKAASRVQATLATSQIAFSLALLVLAGLFIQSLAKISRIDLGMHTESLLTFSISPELNGYTPAQSRQLFDRLDQELAELPGVLSASSARVPLLSGSNWNSNVTVEGFETHPEASNNVSMNMVGTGYFQTMGVPLLAGRDFRESDNLDSARVVIVNRRFAEQFQLGNDVVGRRMAFGQTDGELDMEIIGLIETSAYSEVKGAARAQVFQPRRQMETMGYMNFYVRSNLPAEHLSGPIRALMAQIDPNLPINDMRSMSQQIRENIALDRVVSTLAAAFAILATLLASMGLYGVLSYTVTQRTREIGLRLALGAPPTQVRNMVLRKLGWMALAGAAFGLTLALLLARGAESLLYGMSAFHAPVVVGSATLLGLVVLAAGYLPARRASSVDPMQVLRSE